MKRLVNFLLGRDPNWHAHDSFRTVTLITGECVTGFVSRRWTGQGWEYRPASDDDVTELLWNSANGL